MPSVSCAITSGASTVVSAAGLPGVPGLKQMVVASPNQTSSQDLASAVPKIEAKGILTSSRKVFTIVFPRSDKPEVI